MTIYRETLQSKRWQQLKWRRLKVAGFGCERCGTRYLGRSPRGALRCFELHHVTYAHVGAELLDDVRVLCGACHGTIHGLYEKYEVAA